jgi:predicted enzyme related to lactoylglutathione lyase
MRNLFIIAGALALAAGMPAAAQSVETGLHAIKIAVQDPAQTTRFYAVLGMAAGARFNSHESELRWTDPARGSGIVMVEDQPGRPPRSKGGSFLMISVNDVPATVTRLKAAGFAIPGEPRITPRATIMMLKDPDGNTIELLGGPFGAPTKP